MMQRGQYPAGCSRSKSSAEGSVGAGADRATTGGSVGLEHSVTTWLAVSLQYGGSSRVVQPQVVIGLV